jgi:hypothetical protein
MQWKTLYYFLFILSVISSPLFTVQAQNIEICDNAIDDDGNGLIDLNDPTCDCQSADPLSLIPNPSFEDTNCCPSNNGELYCAASWIQASEATTDYYHRCGYFMRYQFTVPLPLPDGDAYIGFRNGRYIGNGNPNWKEYTGACLRSPLLAGTPYTFQFHIGFIDAENSPPMDVVLYGTTDCKNLPFGIGDREFGCPTNGPNWRVLGKVSVQGDHVWLPFEITTIPPEDITAIAIGPDCDKLNIHYDVKDKRVVFPVEHNDIIVDAVGRSVTKLLPKWKRYGKSNLPFVHGCGRVAVVVEDCVSASVVGSDVLVGVAVLGTSLSESHKRYLMQFSTAIIALDPDALTKTLAFAKELRGYVPDVRVLRLIDDLKYRNPNDISNLHSIGV